MFDCVKDLEREACCDHGNFCSLIYKSHASVLCFRPLRFTPHCVKTSSLHFLRRTQHNKAVWRRRRPPHRFLSWAEIKTFDPNSEAVCLTITNSAIVCKYGAQKHMTRQCRAVASVRKVISNAKSRRSDTRLHRHRLGGGVGGQLMSTYFFVVVVIVCFLMLSIPNYC